MWILNVCLYSFMTRPSELADEEGPEAWGPAEAVGLVFSFVSLAELLLIIFIPASSPPFIFPKPCAIHFPFLRLVGPSSMSNLVPGTGGPCRAEAPARGCCVVEGLSRQCRLGGSMCVSGSSQESFPGVWVLSWEEQKAPQGHTSSGR